MIRLQNFRQYKIKCFINQLLLGKNFPGKPEKKFQNLKFTPTIQLIPAIGK